MSPIESTMMPFFHEFFLSLLEALSETAAKIGQTNRSVKSQN
jgi:hypothetical protein